MKSLKKIGEFGLIDQIAKRIKNSKRVQIGIGDDAALVHNLSEKSLLTTDLLIEGVDFDFKTAAPNQVGHKALAVNLSDIAAMGGVPKFALIGLGVPKNEKLSRIDKFLDGILKIARRFDVDIVGGDLSKAPCWMISVTLIGTPGPRTVSRSGARAGDLIYVTGSLGGSIAGKHLDFTPRVKEGQWLAGFGATSMIDLSDGLLQDLGHILTKSRLGARINLDSIPASGILNRALTDGEDFELLFTIPQSKQRALEFGWKKKFKTKLSCIGEIVPNDVILRLQPKDLKSQILRRRFATSQNDRIIFLKDGKPTRLQFKKKGYQHFG